MFRIFRKNVQVGRVTLPYPGTGAADEASLGVPEINPGKCTGCGKCVEVCPSSALSLSDEIAADRRKLFLSRGNCISCGLCKPACPHDAIVLKSKGEGSAKSKEELAALFSFKLSDARRDASFVIPPQSTSEDGRLSPDLSPVSVLSKEILPDDFEKKLSGKIKKLFGRSLHIREVDAGSCNACEVEMVNLSNPVYDAERFGIHFVASPRHADMLLVTGPVSRQMELALLKTYQAVPSPKLVVACGSCAIGGGFFSGSYAVAGGADRVLPVDVYVPGCPPSPEAILKGIFLALDKRN